jgi:hypothetical protein
MAKGAIILGRLIEVKKAIGPLDIGQERRENLLRPFFFPIHL